MNNGETVNGPEPDEPDSPAFNESTSGVEPLNRLHPTGTDLRRWTRKRKLDMLGELIATLDMLIFAQLSILYLLDNSFSLFVLRNLVQLIYLAPLPLPRNVPPTRPFVGGILGTNLIALVYHVWAARPEAGEVTRGYMHGSLMLDFIGQKGPTSKIHLTLLDLVVLVMQAAALTAYVNKKKASLRSKSSRDARDVVVEPGETMQDHDAEERGVLRGDASPSISRPDVEIGTSLLSREDRAAQVRRFHRHMRHVDQLYSGQALVTELLVLDAMWEQHKSYMVAAKNAPLMPFFSSSSGGRARWRLNIPFRS